MRIADLVFFADILKAAGSSQVIDDARCFCFGAIRLISLVQKSFDAFFIDSYLTAQGVIIYSNFSRSFP